MNDFCGIFPENFWGGRPSATIVGLLNEKFGLSMDIDRTDRRKEDYYLEKIPEVTPISEVLATAQKMQGIVPMAIASRGQRELVDATLDAFGITKMFQAIICTEYHVNGKPIPDPFLVAAERIGVAAPECIAFEGSFTAASKPPKPMAWLGFLCLRRKHKK
jgi:beta-phosphoglucomutase-like phosphatase (HAD superfamily)